MAIFPYRFSSDPSLKPKDKKEVKKMACGSKKKSKGGSKCGKKGGK